MTWEPVLVTWEPVIVTWELAIELMYTPTDVLNTWHELKLSLN